MCSENWEKFVDTPAIFKMLHQYSSDQILIYIMNLSSYSRILLQPCAQYGSRPME